MKVNRKCEPQDAFMVVTDITTGSVSQYYINLPSVFPYICKGQCEVPRRKDLDSNAQWHHDIFTCVCVCVCKDYAKYGVRILLPTCLSVMLTYTDCIKLPLLGRLHQPARCLSFIYQGGSIE